MATTTFTNKVLKKMQKLLDKNPDMTVGELIQRSHSQYVEKADTQMWFETDEIFLKRLIDFEKGYGINGIKRNRS